MKKKIFYFVASAMLVYGAQASAWATSVSVSSIPQGMMGYNLPAGSTSYVSLPLTGAPVYAGTVASVTATTITVSGSPFGSSLTAPSAPYFVEFVSGTEVGRIMQVTGNTPSTLTVDTTDNGASWTNVPMNTSAFTVKAGDMFEVVPGDTLGSVFGTGSSSAPLLLTGGTSSSSADQVTLERATSLTNATYFYNTSAHCWQQTGSSANANNAVIPPYSALKVTRVSGGGASGMTLTGQVATVPATFHMIPKSWTFTGSHYPVGIKLSQLNLSSTWKKSNTSSSADLICVWSPSQNQFNNYYEDTSSNWHLASSPSANQNNLVITPGNVLTVGNVQSTTGGQNFVVDAMPYSLK